MLNCTVEGLPTERRGGKAIIRKVTLRICLHSAPSLTAGKLRRAAHRFCEGSAVGPHGSPKNILEACPSATHEIPINDAGDVMHGTYLHALNGEYILPFPGRLKVNRAILHVGVCLNDGWMDGRSPDRSLAA